MVKRIYKRPPGGKIGIFDSGLGGLVIAKSIFKKMPGYDYIYLGDTLNLPYGDKTKNEIYRHTKRAVDFLFRQDCEIIIIACNSASANALRQLQQKYLPAHYPGRRILGVIIPTLEVADQYHSGRKIGIIGTSATINSHIYKKELKKIDPAAKTVELATPKLVPLIEKNSLQKAEKALKSYLEPLTRQGIEALILGCTHYPILEKRAKKIMGKKVSVVSQTDFLPEKLKNYLRRHREIRGKLSRRGKRKFLVTKLNKNFSDVAKRLFGQQIYFQVVTI